MNGAARNFVMWRCSVCLVLLVSNFPKGDLEQISSKLDFGPETTTSEYDSTLSSSLVKALVHLQHSTGPGKTIISSKLDQNPFNLRSIAPLVQNQKPDFTSLGVICVDGKCNTTDEKRSPEDKVSTDILVQVVTNVDNKKENKTTGAGEDSDVPIVVGYGGTNIQPNGLDQSARRIDSNQDVTITTGTDTFSNEVPKDHFQPVPHFEPNFNNHYFGESPPPQFVWYRRRNGYNPHAFISTIRQFKPFNQQWQLKYPQSNTHTPNGWSQTTACSCTNPGLNWYPSFGPHQPTPPAPINDKMEPLNKK